MHTAEAGTMGDLSVHERGIETPEQQEQRRSPEAASIWVRKFWLTRTEDGTTGGRKGLSLRENCTGTSKRQAEMGACKSEAASI